MNLVIPATECTLGPLHALRDHPLLAGRAAIPPARALETALDKERLRALAVELGIPTPESAYVTSPEALDDGRIDQWLAEGAAVVKATVSKAWNGARAYEFPAKIVRERDELRRVVTERVRHVPVQVQQWVPGRGVGVEVLARHGEIALSVAHERLHEVPLTGGGSSYRRTIPMPHEEYQDAARLMRALACHGVAMVEFRSDPATGRRWLMEINMRFWGSLHLALRAGADFPRALVEMLLFDRVPNDPPPRPDVYARNVSRDIEWMKLIRKRGRRATAQELVRPLGRSLVEWGRVFTGREVWDGVRLDDPGPFGRELQRLVTKEAGTAAAKLRRALTKRTAARSSKKRARRFDQVRNVLVLCYGNICRSPYVEARLRARADGARQIRSAGFYPQTDRHSPDTFQRIAGQRGVDLGAHRSRVVADQDLDWADVIVIMDERNHGLLRELSPASLDKVVWLGALDGEGVEIDDPYDLPEAEANAVLDRLDRCVDLLAAPSAAR